MEQEKDKKKLFMIGMSVLLVLILVIGGTYAWFTLQLNGTKVNVLKAGTLSLILNDENSVGINSEKAVPMLDAVGETLDPHHFTLENHSDIASEYTIYLDDIDLEADETRMSDSFVKYQLTKDGTKMKALLNTIGEHPNRVLDSGTIEGNTTITYDLRLWIDEATGNEAMGQVVRTKIRVIATQSQQVEKAPNENILNVYSYSIEEATKCLTGEEATCVELTERPTTYEAGTIVKYQVNDTESKYFHVMFDEGDTLVIQQRENTINSVSWYDGGDGQNDNTKGPLTALPALEEVTKGWSNVKDQTYTMGTTVFKDNAYTGCQGAPAFCSVNTYVLPERTAKARMITVQESIKMGCKSDQNQSCPIWMYNYLKINSSYGGTETGVNWGYWMMSANSSSKDGDMVSSTVGAADIISSGMIGAYYTTEKIGVRAVVVIDK